MIRAGKFLVSLFVQPACWSTHSKKTKHPIHPRIIVGTMRLMGTGINLTRARQIIDPEYTSYAEQQAEGRITRIGQINHTTAYILVCYGVEIERRIKRRHRKRAMMIRGTVRPEKETSELSPLSRNHWSPPSGKHMNFETNQDGIRE